MTPESNVAHRGRRSIRLRGWDYRDRGAYFVTIVTHDRQFLFGEVVNGEMVLSDFGQIVVEEWKRTAELRPYVRLDAFVVMPNHIHGIIWIVGDIPRRGDLQVAPAVDDRQVAPAMCDRQVAPAVDDRQVAPAMCDRQVAPAMCDRQVAPAVDDSSVDDRQAIPTLITHTGGPRGPQSGSIGAIIAGFKSAVTKRVNQLRETPDVPVWQRNYYERIIRNERELHATRRYILNNPANWHLDRDNPSPGND